MGNSKTMLFVKVDGWIYLYHSERNRLRLICGFRHQLTKNLRTNTTALHGGTYIEGTNEDYILLNALLNPANVLSIRGNDLDFI